MAEIIKNITDYSKVRTSIQTGSLVIFPTETVYGLGANALDSKAVDKIFKAKSRATNNPLIVHLCKKEDIVKYTYQPNEVEQKLIDSFMPGPFTLILKKRDVIPNNVSAGLDSIGIRIPSNEIANNFIREVDRPIAAPSANLSTLPSGTNVYDIKDEFNASVDYIIDGGDSKIGLESTVVKVINNIPTILRPGFITYEDIIDVIGRCNIGDHVLKEVKNEIAESPGMMYKHYSPKTRCLLIYAKNFNDLLKLIEYYQTSKTIILGSSRLKNISCHKYLCYGDTKEEIAHNIFKELRLADTYQGDLIIIEGVSKDGLGLAIMNRLIRTAGYNYIEKE